MCQADRRSRERFGAFTIFEPFRALPGRFTTLARGAFLIGFLAALLLGFFAALFAAFLGSRGFRFAAAFRFGATPLKTARLSARSTLESARPIATQRLRARQRLRPRGFPAFPT